MKKYLPAILLTFFGTLPAQAEKLPKGLTVDMIRSATQTYLSTEKTYQDAIHVLDCGETLPKQGSTDVILYYAFSKPTEQTLNRTTTHRLDRVVELYKHGYSKTIIVTGSGYPETGFAETEKAYLSQNGVQPEQMIMDDTSKTTWENIQHGLSIFEKEKVHSAIFVSSPWHINRILRMFEQQSKALKYDSHHFEIYWATYDQAKEDFDPKGKKEQVQVEISQTLKNALESGPKKICPLEASAVMNTTKKEAWLRPSLSFTTP